MERRRHPRRFVPPAAYGPWELRGGLKVIKQQVVWLLVSFVILIGSNSTPFDSAWALVLAAAGTLGLATHVTTRKLLQSENDPLHRWLWDARAVESAESLVRWFSVSNLIVLIGGLFILSQYFQGTCQKEDAAKCTFWDSLAHGLSTASTVLVVATALLRCAPWNHILLRWIVASHVALQLSDMMLPEREVIEEEEEEEELEESEDESPIVIHVPDRFEEDVAQGSGGGEAPGGAQPTGSICSLTALPLSDPAMAADGFTYNRFDIEQWLRSGRNWSPISGVPLADHTLLPNHALRVRLF